MDVNPYESPRESDGYKSGLNIFWMLPKREPWRGYVIAVIAGVLLGLGVATCSALYNSWRRTSPTVRQNPGFRLTLGNGPA
jgi:hypothetical protein